VTFETPWCRGLDCKPDEEDYKFTTLTMRWVISALGKWNLRESERRTLREYTSRVQGKRPVPWFSLGLYNGPVFSPQFAPPTWITEYGRMYSPKYWASGYKIGFAYVSCVSGRTRNFR